MNEEHNRGREPGPHPSSGAFSQDFRHTAVSARVPEKVARGVFCTATMILQTQDDFIIDFLSTMTPPQQIVARIVMTAPTFSQFVAAVYTNLAVYEQSFGRLIPRAGVSGPQSPAGGSAPTMPASPGHGGGSPGHAGSPASAVGGPASLGGGPPGPVGGSVEYAGGVPGSSQAGGPAGRDPQARAPAAAGPVPNIDDVYDQLKLPDEMLGGAFANVVMIRHTPEEFCFDFIANFYPRSVVAARVYMAAGRIIPFLDAISGALQQYRHRTGGGALPPGPGSPPQA